MSLKKIGTLLISTLVMLLGFTVMVGWLIESDIIVSLFPGFESMKWNTAMGFLFAGASLCCTQFNNSKVHGFLSTLFAVLTLAIGFSAFGQYVFRANWGIDEFFVKDFHARMNGAYYPGRMAFSTALSFLLLGSGLVLIKSRQYWLQFISQGFLHTVAALSLVAILGYMYKVPTLHKFSFLVSMALLTAVCFFLLSMVASFSHKNLGLNALFFGQGVGSLMARKLFPFLAISLVVLGAMGVFVLRRQWLAPDFAIAIFVILFLFLGLFLIWNTAKTLNNIDRRRRSAEESIISLNRELEGKIDRRTEALRRMSDRLKMATSSTGIGILEYSPQQDIVKLDDTLKKLHGISNDNGAFTLGAFMHHIYEEDQALLKLAINESATSGKELNYSYRVPVAGSGLRYFNLRAAAIYGKSETKPDLIGTAWDITEQKIAEHELRKSNERNKIFVDQAPNAIAMFDKNMCYMAASEQWRSDYGLKDVELIGKSHYEIFPEIGDDWKKTHQACLAGAIDRNEEGLFERQDGSRQYLKWEVRPWYLSEKEIGGLLMYTEDITHIKEAEFEQRRIEKILSTTSEAARIGTWEVDMSTQKVVWSDITKEIHEVEPDFEPDLESGINFYKEGYSRNTISRLVTESIEKGTTYDVELQIVATSGTAKWVRVIGQAEVYQGKCLRIFGVFQDIDQKKQTQQQLQKVNQELKAILDSGTYISIISTDLEGTITHFSKGAETLLGYKAEELVNKSSPAVLHVAEEVEARGEELSAEFNKEVKGFDVFVEYAREGKFENRQWTYVRKDGTTFPVQLAVTAIYSEEGDLTGFLGIAADISEIKDKEARINEAKAKLEALTEKLSAQNRQLANFAHITSHNLRSPVSNLLMLLNMYKGLAEEASEKEHVFQKFETVINHLSETLHDLMAALQIQEDVNIEREWIKFSDVFSKITSMLEGDILNTNATIKTDFSGAEKVYYNRGYLESISLNLVSNALKYRSPEREPHVEISTYTDENGGVWLKVADNGLGINLQRHGKKLFGLHKTFHRHKEAKGVGLYLTKTQIETLGGSISATSEVDKGTEFTINFNKTNEN
jgi:PAS domain S-box-containing protein